MDIYPGYYGGINQTDYVTYGSITGATADVTVALAAVINRDAASDGAGVRLYGANSAGTILGTFDSTDTGATNLRAATWGAFDANLRIESGSASPYYAWYLMGFTDSGVFSDLENQLVLMAQNPVAGLPRYFKNYS